jgi:hypothetical protein
MGKGAMIDKILSACKDYHLPICLFVFIIGSVMQWFRHLDMAYVAYTGTVLGAITGHSFSPAGKPDGGNNGT